LDASARDLGLVFAAGGVGAVGAALWMSQRGHPRRDISVMYLAWTVATLAITGYGLATAAWQLMVACLIFNALETAGTIVWATVKQRHVRSGMLGRVSSLDWLISIGLLPISFALTAPVAALVGVRATLVGAGLVGAAAMAVFGIPEVHEDDALRAVRAAVEIHERVAELGLEVRIGLNTGEIVAGVGETLVTGDAVNVAARLEQAATAGETLLG